MSIKDRALAVAEVVHDAGGKIVGRTRLQKIAYLLTAAGFESRFSFEYKHYGPYSEDLSQLSGVAKLLGYISESTSSTQWGGSYSTYTESDRSPVERSEASRRSLAEAAAKADAVELELAATAVFLFLNGSEDPWAETARRKPEKVSGGRLLKARHLYDFLRSRTESQLPAI